MASASTVRHPKGRTHASPEAGPTAGGFLSAVLDSSVGAKLTVGITGLALVGFVIAHRIGNLKVFQGPDAINHYAYFLKHDLGILIWIARAGLLGVFLLHLVLALRLQFRSRAARPVPYSYPGSVQASIASRLMMQTGIVVGIFIVFHLAHFTFGWVKDAQYVDASGKTVVSNYLDLVDSKGRHDVYRMMVAGFQTSWISILYIVAQLVLFLHLRHGIPSTLQTLGVKSARWMRPIDLAGLAIALAILVGNLSIVIAVWAGYVS